MRRGRPRHPELLTPREQEVLSLIREGLTNEQIAERLKISESGARYHVSEILSKLEVSSRLEAAAWSGDITTPAPASILVLARLRRLVGQGPGARWAAAGIGFVALALIALAIGVTVNEIRGSDQKASVPTPTPGSEVSQMVMAEAQAREIRDVVAPDAYLFRMNYVFGRDTKSYSFLYANPDGYVAIQHASPPSGDQAWNVTTVPIGQFAPEPLDLARVVYTPQDLYGAAVSLGAAPPRDECAEACFALILDGGASGSPDSPEWYVTGIFQNSYQSTQVACGLDDNALLSDMNCGPTAPPWPSVSPSPPTPLRVQTAGDTQEVADLGLRLARVFESEAHLFTLSALVDKAFEVGSYYRLGFASPDGRTQIAMDHDRTQWRIEIVELDEPEPQRALDLSGLKTGPGEVVEAARAAVADASYPFRAGTSLNTEDGDLVWVVTGIVFGNQATCTVPDAAPLSQIACELQEATPSPAPPTSTPRP